MFQGPYYRYLVVSSPVYGIYHLTYHDKEKGIKSHEIYRSKDHHHHGLEHELGNSNTSIQIRRQLLMLKKVHKLSLWFVYLLTPVQRDHTHTESCKDIGGGSLVNGTCNSLLRIPLRGMIRQCS